jgi:hypothetical protein
LLPRTREAERRTAHPVPIAAPDERGTAADLFLFSSLACEGGWEGVRSPFGAPLRLLRPGRASWDYRVQTGGPSPAPVQRAPRSPVTRRTGRCPSRLQGKSDELHPQAPHPLRQSASPVTSLTTSRMPPLCRAKESRQGLYSCTGLRPIKREFSSSGGAYSVCRNGARPAMIRRRAKFSPDRHARAWRAHHVLSVREQVLSVREQVRSKRSRDTARGCRGMTTCRGRPAPRNVS